MADSRIGQSAEDRIKFVLFTATNRSLEIIETRSHSSRTKKSADNYRRIHELCVVLLSDQKSPTRPDAAALARMAAIKGISFLAERTLINYYRDMIKVWTDAHREIVALKVQSILYGKKSKVLASDAEIQSLEDIVRVLYTENCELRRILGTKEPSAPSAAFWSPSVSDEPSYVDVKPVREWIRDLDKDSSFLRVSKVGLKLKSNARPDFTIVSRQVFDVLKAL